MINRPSEVAEGAVMATNDDASECKKSAVAKGYWSDPFIDHFILKRAPSKTPEISRGYYARVASMKTYLHQFIETCGGSCQVVNIGAGFDTSFWNLVAEDCAPDLFIELDFPQVTRQKAHRIFAKQELLTAVKGEETADPIRTKEGIESSRYRLLGCDLRKAEEVQRCLCDNTQYADQSKRIGQNSNDQHKADHLEATEKRSDTQTGSIGNNQLAQGTLVLHESGASSRCISSIDYSKPTLFMAECVLPYMPPDSVLSLLLSISERFSSAAVLTYDLVNMGDRFGEVMLSNMESRQCDMYFEAAMSEDTQRHRFLSSGFEHVYVHSMTHVYGKLPQADVQRIERLEFLDEVHLLTQLMTHYCVCYAFKDSSQTKSSLLTEDLFS